MFNNKALPFGVLMVIVILAGPALGVPNEAYGLVAFGLFLLGIISTAIYEAGK